MKEGRPKVQKVGTMQLVTTTKHSYRLPIPETEYFFSFDYKAHKFIISN